MGCCQNVPFPPHSVRTVFTGGRPTEVLIRAFLEHIAYKFTQLSIDGSHLGAHLGAML